jgi:hypothetical protein
MIQSDPIENLEESEGSVGGAAPVPPIDPNLAKIVAAWPMLPEPTKRAMLALIG